MFGLQFCLSPPEVAVVALGKALCPYCLVPRIGPQTIVSMRLIDKQTACVVSM